MSLLPKRDMTQQKMEKKHADVRGICWGLLRRAICALVIICLLNGCRSQAQVSEGGQGADEVETTTDAALEETTEAVPTEAPTEEMIPETEAPVVEASMTVEEWLMYNQTCVEERDAWIVSFGPLNVRRFCYAKGTIIGSFDAGQKVTVTGPLKYGFYPVRGTDLATGEEINGYCSADYVTFMEYDDQAVRLDITRYSQTDSRWKDIKLGKKYTIGDIGCTTSCFAMCESYLTGNTITPADMCEMLTYTNGGDLYWPEGYVVSYNGDYLSVIYQKLHQGIPVLIGSRRNSGSQHWVLVTGYDPGDKEITKSSQLKAADFIIKDPGQGRTTLGQFFKDLPRFIKFVYYVGPEGIYTQSQHMELTE